MVFLEHRHRVYYIIYNIMYSLTTAVEATALFVPTTCKGRNYCIPRDPADDCERTATAALPTAASPGFISGELGTSAALDAFSTVYELRRRLTNLLALISSAVFHRQRYVPPAGVVSEVTLAIQLTSLCFYAEDVSIETTG